MKSGKKFPVCVSKIFYSTEKEKKQNIDVGQQAKYHDKCHDKWKVIETAVPNKLLVFFSQRVPVYLSTLSVRD